MSSDSGLPAEAAPCVERAMFVLEHMLAYIFLAAVALNFLNVVGRYVFGKTILSADELQIFAMIFMTFIGFSAVTWRRAHLRMDVLAGMLPPPLRTSVAILEWAVFVALGAFIVYQSSIYAFMMYSVDRTSDMAGIPMWIPHGAIAVGFALAVAVLFLQAWFAVRDKVARASATEGRSGTK